MRINTIFIYRIFLLILVNVLCNAHPCQALRLSKDAHYSLLHKKHLNLKYSLPILFKCAHDELRNVYLGNYDCPTTAQKLTQYKATNYAMAYYIRTRNMSNALFLCKLFVGLFAQIPTAKFLTRAQLALTQ